MLLYGIIVGIVLISLCLLNHFFATTAFGFSDVYMILALLISFVVIVALDGLTAFLVHRLPKSYVNPFKRIYKVESKEKNFYQKLGIKHWKDRVPELGKLCGFEKKEIAEPKNKDYIFKYLEESCYGSLGHIISCVLGFSIIFICPLKYCLCFGIPIAVTNVVLNCMSTFVLRYNRYKLFILYKKLERDEQKRIEEEKNNNYPLDTVA